MQNWTPSTDSANIDMTRSPLVDEALGRQKLHGAMGPQAASASLKAYKVPFGGMGCECTGLESAMRTYSSSSGSCEGSSVNMTLMFSGDKVRARGTSYFLLLSITFGVGQRRAFLWGKRAFIHPGILLSRQAKCSKASGPGSLGHSILKLKKGTKFGSF